LELYSTTHHDWVENSNSGRKFQGVQSDPMTSKFLRYFLAIAISVPVAAMAQTGNAGAAPAAAPAAPSATPATTPAATPAAAPPLNGTRIASINIEQAIVATNEGQRDFAALTKKLEPKQSELKNTSDEIEGLKKQFSNQGDKLNDESRASLQKQIETKQKSFERSVQDAREDAQAQQNEIAQRILQKLFPVLAKYASANGVGMIIDTSQQWPQGPVIFSGESMDITRPVVEAYNAQSGVPAPPPGTGTKPATKPATTPATKPATAPATKPAAPAATPPKPQGKQ
jgi:Skp family chaperone for outer membrane proteins